MTYNYDYRRSKSISEIACLKAFRVITSIISLLRLFQSFKVLETKLNLSTLRQLNELVRMKLPK